MTKNAHENKPYHHGNLKDALLIEAESLIAKEGLAALSLRELARRVGVTQAAIYRHFPDKKTLLLEVAHSGFRALGRLMADARTSHEIGEAFRIMGTIYIDFALQNKELFKLMFGPELCLTKEDAPSCGDEEEPFHILQNTLAEGIANGMIVDRDPELLAITAWAQVHGLATIVLDRLSGEMPEEAIRGIVNGSLEIFGRAFTNRDEGVAT